MATPNEIIGENVRRMRIDADLTQVKLAKRIGIGQSHLSQVECGHCGTSVDMLRRIAAALQTRRTPSVTAARLLKGV